MQVEDGIVVKIIAALLGMLGVSWGWIYKRTVIHRQAKLESELSDLNASLLRLNEKLAEMDKRLAVMEERDRLLLLRGGKDAG